jgi:hypothetical protein
VGGQRRPRALARGQISTAVAEAADPPDGGPVAFRPGSDGLNRFARGDGQDDARVLDLEPSQASVVSHRLQDGAIRSRDGHGARLASTHGATSDARAGAISSIPGCLEFVA